MTVDEIIKHCDDYITSMNKYADTGNIGWWLEFYHTVLNGFRELKALEDQQQDVHDTCKKCIEFSEFEQQPSEPRTSLAETSQDCISREEVQDLISIWLSDYLLDETREALETINYKVGDMPAVYPERPKGKWTLHSDYPDRLICEKCKAQFDMWHWESKKMHYCPNCGAEMEGGKDENNFGR